MVYIGLHPCAVYYMGCIVYTLVGFSMLGAPSSTTWVLNISGVGVCDERLRVVTGSDDYFSEY